MKLNGIGFSTAFMIAAAFAAGLLVLYILKLRRRRITVPFTPLWSRVLVDREATSWLQRLKRLLSLLLWIAIMLLVVGAMTDPQPEQELERGRTVLLLIDTSASMSAKESGDDDASRYELAQRRAMDLIDEMGPHDKMMVMAMDGQVRSVTGDFTENQATLRSSLEKLRPTATEASAREGLRTAVDTVSGRKEPHIVLISDGAFGSGFEFDDKLIPKDITFEHILVGRETGNVAISGFNIRRYLSNKLDYEVFVQVRNYFDKPVFAELSLFNLVPDPARPGKYFYRDIEKVTLEVGPGSSEFRFYENLALGSDHLAARIEVKGDNTVDALPLDNEAFVLVPKFKRAHVLAITEFRNWGSRRAPANLFLEAALLLNDNFDVDFMSPDDPALHPGGSEEIRLSGLQNQGYDAVIFDNSQWKEGETGISPAPDVPGNYLYINPRGTDSPFKVSPIDEAVYVERIDRRHPISRWLVMKDAGILRGTRIRAQGRDKVIVRSVDGPLIVSRRDRNDGSNLVGVGFSLTESDLVFRVALPVLLINTIDWFMDEANSLIRAFGTGQNWHIPVPLGVTSVNITAPDGETDENIPTFEGEAVYYGQHSGFYTMSPGADSNVPLGVPESWEIAANFSSPRESDIAPAEEPLPSQEGVRVKEEEKEALDPRLERWSWVFEHLTYDLWLYCVFLVLGLLVIEFFTYHRRWTV